MHQQQDPFSSTPNYFGSGGTAFQPVSASSSGYGGGTSSVPMGRQPTPPQTFRINTNNFTSASSNSMDPFGGVGTSGGVASSGAAGGFYNAPPTQHDSASPFFGNVPMDHSRAGSGGPVMGGSSSSTRLDATAGVPADPIYRTRFGFAEDDLPLLDELGIFPRHIKAKAMAVLNPLSPIPPDAIEDMDLAGPIMCAIALGFLLSLQGKVQFGAIYGLSLMGILFAKMLLTLMCDQHAVSIQFVVSTLGYCLIPNLVLALIQTFQYWLIGSHTVILPFAFVVIGWSAWCSTTMFVSALAMDAQRYLILYPCVLFYAVFAALTIF